MRRLMCVSSPAATTTRVMLPISFTAGIHLDLGVNAPEQVCRYEH